MVFCSLLTNKQQLLDGNQTGIVIAGQTMSVFSPTLCLKLSSLFGRPKTIVLVRFIEPAALLVMGFVTNNVHVAAGTFVLFLGLPIGSKAIEKAVLMDYSPKRSRGKWNALESINRVSWAGSAALGGVLATYAGWFPVFASSGFFVGLSVLTMSGLLTFMIK